ncbi:MAG: FmdB family zinc ribbon protein [Methermicoccaceae archaeon]
MGSIGDGFDMDMEDVEVVDYECEECKNRFKAMGKDVRCPSCRSKNVRRI